MAFVIKIAVAVINHILEAQKLDMKLYHAVFLVSETPAASCAGLLLTVTDVLML